MDVDLAATELDLLVLSSTNQIQCVGWWRIVEKDRNRSIGRELRKRVGCEHMDHLGGAADHDPDWLAGIGSQCFLQYCFDRALGLAALADDIAAGDVGANRSESGGFAHRLELAHRQLSGAADI